ncbi:MAG: 16S rRNA (guanine(527)-N(7))-methyltransferase RsmG [Candidatus Promineifilaceae bacterium]
MHLLSSQASKLGLSLSSEQLMQFSAYQHMLLSWNARFNLSAVRTVEGIQLRHFADSLTCVLVTGDLTGQSLIDVGSGAGLPGLPLKICFPQLALTLVESVRKKAHFLEAVTAELGFEDVLVLPQRAEDVARETNHRGRYDWAAARAVAHLSPLLEYLLPFCRLGGCALAQKGTRVEEELQEARHAMEILGGELTEIRPVDLEGKVNAHLVVVKKVRTTPEDYPRRAGMPVKRPL